MYSVSVFVQQVVYLLSLIPGLLSELLKMDSLILRHIRLLWPRLCSGLLALSPGLSGVRPCHLFNFSHRDFLQFPGSTEVFVCWASMWLCLGYAIVPLSWLIPCSSLVAFLEEGFAQFCSDENPSPELSLRSAPFGCIPSGFLCCQS